MRGVLVLSVWLSLVLAKGWGGLWVATSASLGEGWQVPDTGLRLQCEPGPYLAFELPDPYTLSAGFLAPFLASVPATPNRLYLGVIYRPGTQEIGGELGLRLANGFFAFFQYTKTLPHLKLGWSVPLSLE